jgi:hypothetical protein
VADFRLNTVLGPPCAAFLAGLCDLIRPQWVTMFNEAELQMLISGGGVGGGVPGPHVWRLVWAGFPLM